jgi:hypothetical protein
MLTDKEKSGDLKKDLTKVANKIGITAIPAEAEIDALNKAIAGATLGAAIAGSYVNPNTGQELRPTAGARIGNAVAQGLNLQRDTETRRANTEAELMIAQEKAKASATSAKLTPAQEQLVELFAKRAETEDPSAVAKKFNEEFGPGVGDMLLEFYRSGAGFTGGTPGQSPETPTGGFKVGQTATGPNGEKIQWDGSSWQKM